jgi:2-polyprenyl-6-methoxyphenol hydroxylase-like FAD-dependent oxidoreductase
MLACELSLCGVSTVLVERLADPMTESRATQLNTRTAEILIERGLQSLLEEAQRESSGHFGGLPIDMSLVDSDYAGNWKVAQHRTEAVLADRASQLGVHLLRSHELRDLRDNGDDVVCEVTGPDGTVELQADYVVGCDGTESTVRRLAEFKIQGAPPTKELLRADITGVSVPDHRFQRYERGLAISATRSGVTRVMVHAFDRPMVGRTRSPDFAEIAAAWNEVTGEDISCGNPVWVDAFDNKCGQAMSYQRGRVLLAGDAAHWHLPIGGQAINLGLQDATNLGWKLAAQVQSWAPAGLLKSYHDERYAAGARIIDNVRTQELLLLGGHEIDGLRASVQELLELGQVRDHFAAINSGLDVHYGKL